MDMPETTDQPAPLTRPFGLGDWRVDPAANRLERDGEHFSVEPKVMDLLALFAAAPGRTFSREALDAALWPGVTVGEDALARAISRLRRALGDAANAPRYIETIPKRGYRLIAAVSLAGEPPLRPPLLHPSAGRFPRRAIMATAIGVLAMSVVAALIGRPAPDAPVSPSAAMTYRADDLYMRFTRADNEAAIALYERAIAADLNYAPAQAGLANALVQRVVRWQSLPGGAPSARSLREALENGLHRNPDSEALVARAIDLGERAVRLAPQNADALKALGFAYSANGEVERASEVYNRAIALDPDAWEVMINLGELASINGERVRARGWFERAYEAMDRLYREEPHRVGPWRAPLGVSIGEAYEEAGEDAAAEAWYRRVLDQTPLEPEATARLARLLRNRGAAGEADRLCAALNARIDAFAHCKVVSETR